jgi:hypothetical protein
MPYEYDVFFSYKRDRQSDAWHHAVMQKLQYWLRHELSKADVPVFFDTEEIQTGARWRNHLAEALRASKTMVCVWSPLYFQSPWCVSEWKTFEARESLCGQELIVPATYFDGACFPDAAKGRQMLDLSNYTSTMARFWETQAAVDFEEKCLRPLARDMAASVRRAPPFSPDFPVVEVPGADLSPRPPIQRIAYG